MAEILTTSGSSGHLFSPIAAIALREGRILFK